MRFSPSVRRALLQHDIDPSRIEGTGRDGRITRADVDRAVEEATPVGRPVEGVLPAATGDIRSHSVPHDRMRLKIAENMLASVTRAPHVTAMFEADFSAIIAIASGTRRSSRRRASSSPTVRTSSPPRPRR
jgi:2-oxoglutarate dehydrogenase E2 component (dihydrolipoamide succinyltransferase)